MAELSGRVAVVLSAGAGIGAACVERLAYHGADVLAIDPELDRIAPACEQVTAAGRTATALATVVTDPVAVAEAVTWCERRWQRLDVLVTAFHETDRVSIEKSSLDSWERVLRVNLLGPVLAMQTFLPLLRRGRNPSVVHVGSVDGLLGNPHVPAYSTAKGGLVALTHVAAHELAQHGIRVNCVARAGVATDEGSASSPVLKSLVAATPLGRLAHPHEVADTVVYLAGDASSYITGTVVVVDGGRIAITPGTT